MKCPLTGQPCFKSKLYHITDIVNGEAKTSDCCSECFKDYLQQNPSAEVEEKPSAEPPVPPKSSPLEFLKTMVDFVDYLSKPAGLSSEPAASSPKLEKDIEEAKKRLPKCKCGYTILDVQKAGKLGCAECYTTFGKQLQKTLEHYQATSDLEHKGKRPKYQRAKKAPVEDRIRDIKVRMKFFIDQEKYEEAAKTRDELNVLEGKERRKRKLKHEMNRHVNKEEYERADEIKKQMEEIDQED